MKVFTKKGICVIGLLVLGILALWVLWAFVLCPEEAELGSAEGDPIDSGFVFSDGRYVEPPYIVSRRGPKILINDVVVRRWREWPLRDRTVKTDPELPDGFTEESSWQDFFRTGHPSRKHRYLHQHFPEDVAMQKMAEYLQELPFVQSVSRWDPRDPEYLRVKTKNGEEKFVDISPPAPDSVSSGRLTRQDVLNRLERWRTHFEERLEKDDTYFFFGVGVELSFGKRKTASNLKLVTEILRSNRSNEEKVLLLQRLSILPPTGTEQFSALVTDFRASEQLEARIDELVAETGVTPTTYDQIPEEIPALMERRLKGKRLQEKLSREGTQE